MPTYVVKASPIDICYAGSKAKEAYNRFVHKTDMNGSVEIWVNDRRIETVKSFARFREKYLEPELKLIGNS